MCHKRIDVCHYLIPLNVFLSVGSMHGDSHPHPVLDTQGLGQQGLCVS